MIKIHVINAKTTYTSLQLLAWIVEKTSVSLILPNVVKGIIS
jgi:hypothetical protein